MGLRGDINPQIFFKVIPTIFTSLKLVYALKTIPFLYEKCSLLFQLQFFYRCLVFNRRKVPCNQLWSFSFSFYFFIFSAIILFKIKMITMTPPPPTIQTPYTMDPGYDKNSRPSMTRYFDFISFHIFDTNTSTHPNDGFVVCWFCFCMF